MPQTDIKQCGISERDMLELTERLPWETNQYMAKELNLSVDTIRKIRSEIIKKHNRHDVDDEEWGRQEW